MNHAVQEFLVSPNFIALTAIPLQVDAWKKQKQVESAMGLLVVKSDFIAIKPTPITQQVHAK